MKGLSVTQKRALPVSVQSCVQLQPAEASELNSVAQWGMRVPRMLHPAAPPPEVALDIHGRCRLAALLLVVKAIEDGLHALRGHETARTVAVPAVCVRWSQR